MRIIKSTISGLFIALAIYSCTAENTANAPKAGMASVSNIDPHFQVFLKNFKMIDLPFVYRVTKEESAKIGKLYKVDLNSSDTTFIHSDNTNEIFCYGMLRDTSRFYTLIYYFAADDFYPVLATYTKSGKLISKEAMIVNGCGPDCGLTDYSTTGILKKDFSIFCADTIKYEYHCDDAGEPIKNSGEIISNVVEGKLGANGRINMNAERNVSIKFN